jgi:hypothetical protein
LDSTLDKSLGENDVRERTDEKNQTRRLPKSDAEWQKFPKKVNIYFQMATAATGLLERWRSLSRLAYISIYIRLSSINGTV